MKRHTIGVNGPGLLASIVVVLSLVAGCASPTPTPPPAPRTQPPTQAPAPTSAPTAIPSSSGDELTLTWWTPEFLSPQASQPAGQVLTKQLDAFSKAQDGKVKVETVRKARYGKGGLLDALRTAQPVAPGTLPDIVALDAAEVSKAVDAGLLQPLNPVLDTSVTEKLYPFASEAGLFNQGLYGVQYLADVDHVAYLTSQVAEAPATWDELIERKTAYLFPLAAPQAGSSQGTSGRPAESLSHAILGQYLSAGATLGADRRLVLEPQPLLKLLTFYADASKNGVLPPAALDLPDGEAVWGIFSQGQAPLALVNARNYVKKGDLQAEYAAPLGANGAAPSVASGWVLAIVTQDPERQRAAAELIAWLLKPENAGEWAASAGWLPTSSDALKSLGTGPYWSYLDGQMAQARALPTGQDYATTAARIQTAIQSVVRDQTDPKAAADAAINGQ